MSDTVSEIRRSADSATVTIGATTAISTLWLTPKLGAFWRSYPDIMISQEVRDRPFQRPFSPDLVIEYAIKRPHDAEAVLFDDWLVPVAAPGFDTGFSGLTDLAHAPLIHLQAKETNWTSWPNWFDAQGYTGDITIKHRVNNYAIALQLAEAGQGIVLGWKRLIDPLLSSGRLAVVQGFGVEAPGRFYLVSSGITKRSAVKTVSTWLTKDELNSS